MPKKAPHQAGSIIIFPNEVIIHTVEQPKYLASPRALRTGDKYTRPTKMMHERPIPTSIFVDRSLSVLEILSEYLKEDQKLNYHQIAVLLNRDDRTIWTCYHRAKKKREQAPPNFPMAYQLIPTTVFQDRTVSVLEAISEYLHQKGLTIHEIAVLLNRDDRTIWTCCNRAKIKREKVYK